MKWYNDEKKKYILIYVISHGFQCVPELNYAITINICLKTACQHNKEKKKGKRKNICPPFQTHTYSENPSLCDYFSKWQQVMLLVSLLMIK